MRYLYVFMLSCFASVLFAQTALEGKVKAKATGEPIMFGTVALYKNGVLTTGGETDLEGNYFISNLQPGTYDVEVSYLGYATTRTTGVLLKASQTTRLNFEMESSSVIVDEVVITEYRAPLVNVDNTTTGTVISGEKIMALPVKGLNAIVATSAGVSTIDGGTPSVRGSRTNETMYMIDGIRTFGTVPQSEIDQLQVITGGIEAKYGDVTGGIISITTRGPSDKLTGGFDMETSSLLTPYGYNLAMGYLSGPIKKNKKGNTILGYRLSGQYRSNKDGSPSAVGVYRMPENIIREIEENPLYALGTVRLPSSERITDEQIGGPLRVRPNEDDRDINLVAKIDARLGKSVNFSISGNYVDGQNRFAPSTSWAVLNWVNNPYSYNSRYRINFNLRHKLGVQSIDLFNDKTRKPSTFQNFTYNLLGGFERGNGRSEDLRHQDRLYNYGYFGSTAVSYNPFFGFITDEVNQTLNFRHLGFTAVNGEFVQGEANSVMAKYNSTNGILNPDLNNVWNNLYNNAGQVYNSFSKSESDLITLNLSAGFDVLPGGSDKGRHSIQFGFIYEQQTLRDWSVAPRGLWRAADLLVNNHIKGINPDVVLRDTTIFNPLTGSLEKLPVYQTLLQIGGQDKFYKSIREKLGVGVNQYVNINGIDPELLTLDLFSPEELTNEGLLNYQGYDYLGNKTKNISFDDFFRGRDEAGIRTFPVAPFSPIYMAGYIQDKFNFKDIIFRLGLRADYYDANTKVLKDPYALYEIETAGDFYSRTGRQKPASVGNDYKVYVTGSESDEVIGYRKGDEWFTTSGTSITNANLIFNGGVVYPSYVGRATGGTPASRVLDIQSTDFDVNTSFKDYAPILNLMPRMAFSFPISEDAGFFAHYDVLYQRPPSNVYMSPLDYYYFNNIGSSGPANNPDLRPIRTIDYEVGFQQKLSENNSLKVSGYQKEMKDLIQNRVYAFVPSPIGRYESYGNLDFGNITGFTFQFDRRRVNNLELNLTYTLQYASGSGSDANSSRGLNTRGPIRNLIPLGVDERHRITAVLDYRYGGGKKYDGPVLGGVKVLENAGLAITTAAVSGRPYTKTSLPQQFGGSGFLGEINGSRYPWNFNIDLRFDKRFGIKPSKNAKALYANFYFRVQNLLDTRNVRSVYSASGSPTDDGFLLSQLGQQRIQEVVSTNRGVDAFIQQYNWRMLAPGNYFLPRRMFMGLMFDF
jgi:hypothetical protein